MAVAIVLRSKKESQLVHWAARIATARQAKLILVWAQQRRGSTEITSCTELESVPAELATCCEDLLQADFSLSSEAAESNGHLPVEVVTLKSANVAEDVRVKLEELKVTSLVLPRDASLRAGSSDASLHDHLVSKLHCEIVLLTPGDREVGICREILTPVGEGPHSASCLQMANDLAKAGNANLVALHVEAEIDVTAEQAAQRILSKSVDRALSGAHELVEERVELANDVVQGIQQAIGDNTDLIILGLKRSGLSKRFNSNGVAGKLVDAKPGPTIAVIQSAVPITSRLGRRVDEVLCSWVPQLPRDLRIKLVARIQRSSRWDFDFVLLICLSTIIAAGGLIQDSAAVVIGAMLVAPLMTPLLGAGLAMVQGNPILFRSTLFTVLRGFLVAFAVGILVAIVAGWFVTVEITGELAARGEPTSLDILVAMVGGVAAAYASGRPNLLSALPGVAIAAALVPPIATSGIALWLGDYRLAFWSALLFVTNIVAIILGTAVAFRATGIRGIHQYGSLDRWTLPAGAILLLLMISLGIFESMPSANRGRSFQSKINQLADQDAWRCTSTKWENIDGRRWLTVRLSGQKAAPQERLDRIRERVNADRSEPLNIRFLIEAK